MTFLENPKEEDYILALRQECSRRNVSSVWLDSFLYKYNPYYIISLLEPWFPDMRKDFENQVGLNAYNRETASRFLKTAMGRWNLKHCWNKKTLEELGIDRSKL